ncbi:MAG: PEP-CTERM sorting domain-containing protein [Planctomycetales bacterium]|nr:PEP-CTERM sorting domain-containing protein [Planctomycetales bacterium]MCA9170700.1 PEP-CTERM sorting domain-containing protein [Planctomycetales bacterium]
MKKQLTGWLLAVALVVAPWSGISRAATVPLSSLLNGGTFQSGDKVFSDFGYSATGDMPPATAVNIEDITDTNGDYGIRISGGFVDQVGGGASDAIVTFNVSVAPNVNKWIDGVTLSANPAVFAGTGLASVTETFIPTITDDKLVVYDFDNGQVKLLDSIAFNQGYKSIPVQKDIILHATGNSGAVTMSFVDQTFHQVPEPTSLVLALGGLCSLGVIRRRVR